MDQTEGFTPPEQKDMNRAEQALIRETNENSISNNDFSKGNANPNTKKSNWKFWFILFLILIAVLFLYCVVNEWNPIAELSKFIAMMVLLLVFLIMFFRSI